MTGRYGGVRYWLSYSYSRGLDWLDYRVIRHLRPGRELAARVLLLEDALITLQGRVNLLDAILAASGIPLAEAKPIAVGHLARFAEKARALEPKADPRHGMHVVKP